MGLVVVAALGLLLFAWSGVYNVAASASHFGVTARLLAFIMRNSVETYAAGIEAPSNLDDAALAERGAGHFAGFCAPCHGAPGVPASVIAGQMLPAPPSYEEAVNSWQDHQLFWVVKHGLKYTGMPAWPAQSRDDEVWAVVAFARGLPGMTAEQYHRATAAPEGPGGPASNPSARLIAREGLAENAVAACARCHGVDGTGGAAGGVPTLAGQRRDYLVASLRDYANGTRPSGIMQPIATMLSEAQRRALAEYYAALPATPGEPRVETVAYDEADLLQRGGVIAAVGDPAAGTPACRACHGAAGRAETNLPGYPALAGQHRDYLEQQLKLWRAGTRGGTHGQIMRAAARNLTDEQIRAVALYYARLPTAE
nr:c-type cytochrome [Rhodoplanes tepidamans]